MAEAAEPFLDRLQAAISGSHPKWRRLGLAAVLAAVGVGWTLLVGDKAGGRHIGGSVIRLELAADGEQFTDLGALRTAVRWDFMFILGYTALLAAAALTLMPLYRLRLFRRSGATLMAWAAVGAGACDVVENVLLLCGVSGASAHGPDGWFLAASTFATVKFVILVLLGLALLGAVLAGCCTPEWLTARLIAESRDDATPPRGFAPAEVERGRGICLSGGGVRAASLTLGSLQELERPLDGQPTGLGWDTEGLRVTAVSGGSYMAGGWQAARGIHRHPQGDHVEPWAWRGGSARSPEEIHLVDNLGYLASTWPRGHRDETGTPRSMTRDPDDTVAQVLRNSASVYATLFVGFMANLLVLVAVLVLAVTALTLALDWLVDLREGCRLLREARTPSTCVIRQPRFWLPPVAWLGAGALLAALWVLVGKISFLRKPRLLNVFKGLTRGSLALGVVLALLLLGFPYLIRIAYRWEWQSMAGAIGALVGYASSLGRLLMQRAAAYAPKIAGILFLAFLWLASALCAVQVLKLDRDDYGELDWTSDLSWLVGVAAAIIVFAWVCGAELWSMFAFYRGKLRLAYAARRFDGKGVSFVNDGDAGGHFATPEQPWPDQRNVAEPSLQDLRGQTPLMICASAHATTRAIKTHYGIPAMGFTFSPESIDLHVPQRGGVFTTSPANLEASYRGSGGSTSHRITTMFAVALAGAAVAPAMGRMRIGPTSALITFGNVRLGAWLPNPRYVKDDAASVMDRAEQMPKTSPRRWQESRQVRFPKVRLSYLFREFFGIHDPSDAYVYVSDGGHWENTGFVELVRGPLPHEVVCVDADPGNQTRVNQLSKAIDLAKLECHVDVFIDLDPLRAFPRTADGQPYADRSVALGVLRHGDDEWGLLWYSKPVLTVDSPTPLLAHREIDPQFPHTSTVDQFFDVSTYEAYRDLGRHNARMIKLGRRALRDALAKVAADPLMLPVVEEVAGGWAVREFLGLADEFPDDQAALLAGARAALV